MPKRKNIWLYFVIALSIVFVAVVGYFVFQNIKDTQQTFAYDGYVLKEALTEAETGIQSKAVALYFKAGEAFVPKYPNTIAFKDVQSNAATVAENSFLHYADGSLGALASGVVLNLSEIEEQGMIRCYAIKPGTVVQSNGGSYSVDHMGTPITYGDFIWKLNPERYLIVGNGFSLKLPSEEPIPISQYVEVQYIDNSIVNIYNNELMLSTIASECVLEFDNGIKIDLSGRSVQTKGTQALSFAQMVVDSYDNIDVTPLSEADRDAIKIPRFVTVDGEDGKDGTSGSGGNAGAAGSAGAVGETIGTGGQEKGQPEAKVILPAFEVNIDQTKLTATSVSGSVRITDAQSRLVPGTVYMKIVENSTGKLIYGPESYEGMLFDFQATGLSENMEYRLIFEAEYTVNDEQYSKIFYDSVFVADALGLSLTFDKADETVLSFKVKKEAFSPVASATLKIYDTNGSEVDSRPVNLLAGSDTISFTGLTANTKYSAQLVNVGGSYSNGDAVQFAKYGTPLACMTLKRAPEVGRPNVTVNKRDGSFEVQISSLTDQDLGVQKIRYEIYETGGTTPVTSVYGNPKSRVDFPVNGVLQRNTEYTVLAVAEFFDNTKTVEFESAMSAPFTMEGAAFPTLSFNPTEIKFERISGTLVIDCSGGATVDTAHNVTIHWQDSVGNVYKKVVSAPVVSASSVILDFNEGGLRQKETYSIWVTARVNLNDSNPIDEVVIGPVKVQTVEASPFNVTIQKTSAEVADPSKAISLDISLGGVGGTDVAYEASTLGFIRFNLYEGNTVTPSKLLKSITFSGTGGSGYASQLKQRFYDRADTLTEADFGLTSQSLLSSTYVLEVELAHDYTNHDSNFFRLVNNSLAFVRTTTPPMDPPVDQRSDALTVVPITKSNASGFGVNLTAWLGEATNTSIKNSTIVGYAVTPKLNNSGRYARRIIYQMHKLGTYHDAAELQNATALSADNTKLTTEGISVPVEASQDYLPTLVVLFGPKGGGPDAGFVGSDRTRYYYYTGDEQAASGGFGRGAQYFFSYWARLNTVDATAAENIDYPSNPLDPGLFLYSRRTDTPMQTPDFTLYPSTSDNTSVTWKYTYTDYDNALAPAAINCNNLTGGTLISSQTITKSQTFNTAQFGGLSGISAYELAVQQNLYPAYGGLSAKRTLLSRVHQTDSAFPLYYSVKIPDDFKNRLYILLATNESQMGIISDALYRRMAGAIVTVTDGVTQSSINLGVSRITIDGAVQTCIEVPYSLFESFADGASLTFTVSALYDTGVSGFDTSATYHALAFPTSGTTPTAGNYRVIRATGSGYTDSPNASGSWFRNMNLNVSSRVLSYAGNMMALNTNEGGSFALTFAEDGAHTSISGDRLVTLKALRSINATSTDGSGTAVPKPVPLPEVSIDLSEDITAGLMGINGQFTVSGLKSVAEDHFYIEFFTSEMTHIPELTLQVPIRTSEGVKQDGLYTFSLPAGLSPNTVYFFRISGIITGLGSDRLSFYDIVAKQPKDYQFKTLGEVQISNVAITYNPNRYSIKSLNAAFTMDTTMGFSLAYDFVRSDSGEVFTHEQMLAAGTVGNPMNMSPMNVAFSINPGSEGGNWFEFGKNYSIYITAYSGAKPTWEEREAFLVGPDSGKLLLGQRVHSFSLENLSEPLMGLSATAELTDGDYKLNIRVAPGDWDRTIVGDLYYLRIFDNYGVDHTPIEHTGVKLATDPPFTASAYGLSEGEQYTIRCYAVTDMQNKGAVPDITQVASPTNLQYRIAEIKAYTLDSSGISPGTVTTRRSPTNPNYAQLMFVDSVSLAELTELRYTVYTGATAVESMKKISFVNLRYDATQNYYYIDLETVFPGPGSYTIQVQYYKDSEKIGLDASYPYIHS